MITQDDILLEMEEKMEKTLHKVQEDLNTVRTGKASPSLVENIRVDVYGSTMRLRELAGITTPESRLILIQPWDGSNTDPIRKAIEESKIGITPQVDGKMIRLRIPELSEERRKEFVKTTREMGENGRVAIRHVRREGLDALKKLQKEGKMTEDELAQTEKQAQQLTDSYTSKIDTALAAKEAELMKV